MISVQVTGNEYSRVVRGLCLTSGELSVTVDVLREDLEAIKSAVDAELARWTS